VQQKQILILFISRFRGSPVHKKVTSKQTKPSQGNFAILVDMTSRVLGNHEITKLQLRIAAKSAEINKCVWRIKVGDTI